jgi:hypothetical protein
MSEFPGTKPSADLPGCSEITDINEFLAELRKHIQPRLDEEDAQWAEHGEAAMRAFHATGATLDTIGGNCPVQAEGTVDGQRFYFRARGEGWQFHVAPTDEEIFDAGRMICDEDYGVWPDAGWMPRHEALGFIVRGISEYRAAQGGVTEGGDGEAGSGPEGTSTRSRSDAPYHDILKGDAGQPNKRGATSHDASGKGIE